MKQELRKQNGLMVYALLMLFGVAGCCYLLYLFVDTPENLFIWGGLFLVAAVTIFLIMAVIHKVGNGFMKNILQYVESNPEISMIDLEEDFEQSGKCGTKVWIGKNYIFGINLNKNAFVYPIKGAGSVEIETRKQKIHLPLFPLHLYLGIHVTVYVVFYEIDYKPYEICVGKNVEDAKRLADALNPHEEDYDDAMDLLHQAWLKKNELLEK